MGPWETWITRFRASWMKDPNAQALFGAIAEVLGDRTDTESNASLTEEVCETANDPASLAFALSERGIEPVAGMAIEALRELSAAAPALNRFRGRPEGQLAALYYSGLQQPHLVQQNGLRFRITSSPVLADLREAVALPSWITRTVQPAANPLIPASTDGRPSIPANTVPWAMFPGGPMDAAGNQFTSRFLFVYPVGIVAPPDFTDAAVLAKAKRVIAAWKPAKAKCVGIQVAGSGVLYDLGAKYGDGSKYGGSGSAFYTVE